MKNEIEKLKELRVGELFAINSSLSVLEAHKQAMELSDVWKPEYFEQFKENKFDDYGKVCLSIRWFKQRKQDILDEAEGQLRHSNVRT